MKIKSLYLYLPILALLVISCDNESTNFDDYGTVACYFPVQTPIRTLILGDYELGFNDNDNAHQFEIGATLAGMRENHTNRYYTYKVDETLLTNVTNVVAMPTAYYSIVTENPVKFASGDMKGRILVKLNDSFFEDPDAVNSEGGVKYVIPLRITDVQNIDTLLSGEASKANAMHANPADWEIAPKDYILYGVKYINKYDATYLRRGVDKVPANGTQVVYRNQYIVRDEAVTVTTSALNEVTLSNMIRRQGEATPGNINLQLTFDNDDKCIIYNGDTAEEIGTGHFQVDSEDGIWSEEKHNVIYLNYSYSEPTSGEMHQVSDTLVYRNRNVVYEEFIPEFN